MKSAIGTKYRSAMKVSSAELDDIFRPREIDVNSPEFDSEVLAALDDGFGSWANTGRDNWAEEMRSEWDRE